VRSLAGAGTGLARRIRVPNLSRVAWVDVAWVIFIVLSLIAMRLISGWQTVPFLIIWISLTVMYGFRLWRLGSAVLTVTLVTVATGGLIGWQVLRGQQDAEYLVEVPLLAIMFVAMVWHARRRQTALMEMKRVSEHNLRLLDQQRQFLQDASHELGTPITIALGHAELIEHAAADQAIASDARVAWMSCCGCAGWPAGCCCWPPPTPQASCTGLRWTSQNSWPKPCAAGARPPGAGPSAPCPKPALTPIRTA
jgi:signal transduction histidine kinase